MLIILAGLPGTGKTTIAERLCRTLNAVHIRVDTIEQALRSVGRLDDDSPAGYVVGFAVARDALRSGHIVVADSVNPVAASRRGWREAARGFPMIEVELTCTDASEHRRRIETRESDVAGLTKPDWHQVSTRAYEPFDPPPDLVIDTTDTDPDLVTRQIADHVRRILSARP